MKTISNVQQSHSVVVGGLSYFFLSMNNANSRVVRMRLALARALFVKVRGSFI